MEELQALHAGTVRPPEGEFTAPEGPVDVRYLVILDCTSLDDRLPSTISH